MRLCISGSHSTGKTTLVEVLKLQPELKDYTFKGNITRQLKEQGFVINEKGDDATQLAVMMKHLEHYIPTNSVLDRCALDGFMYTTYLFRQKRVNINTLRIAQSMFENMEYDCIFYLEPEFGIVKDGVRSDNDKFQSEVREIFEEYIKLSHLMPVRLHGTTEERVNIVLKAVKHLDFMQKQMKNFQLEITHTIIKDGELNVNRI